MSLGFHKNIKQHKCLAIEKSFLSTISAYFNDF